MGFMIKSPKTPASQAVKTAPPVVSETVREDAERNYDQKRANKRGLLSTILSASNRGSSLTPESTGNSTLG